MYLRDRDSHRCGQSSTEGWLLHTSWKHASTSIAFTVVFIDLYLRDDKMELIIFQHLWSVIPSALFSLFPQHKTWLFLYRYTFAINNVQDKKMFSCEIVSLSKNIMSAQQLSNTTITLISITMIRRTVLLKFEVAVIYRNPTYYQNHQASSFPIRTDMQL